MTTHSVNDLEVRAQQPSTMPDSQVSHSGLEPAAMTCSSFLSSKKPGSLYYTETPGHSRSGLGAHTVPCTDPTCPSYSSRDSSVGSARVLVAHCGAVSQADWRERLFSLTSKRRENNKHCF